MCTNIKKEVIQSEIYLKISWNSRLIYYKLSFENLVVFISLYKQEDPDLRKDVTSFD